MKDDLCTIGRHPLAVPNHGRKQEKQEDLIGPDPWAYGLTDANRKVLGTMIRYAQHQGIISQELPVDELSCFDSTVCGRSLVASPPFGR